MAGAVGCHIIVKMSPQAITIFVYGILSVFKEYAQKIEHFVTIKMIFFLNCHKTLTKRPNELYFEPVIFLAHCAFDRHPY